MTQESIAITLYNGKDAIYVSRTGYAERMSTASIVSQVRQNPKDEAIQNPFSK